MINKPSKDFSANISGVALSFWNNRLLIWQLTRREIVGRYKGSLLGLAWSFFNPLAMLTVYTFVFSVVFKARWQVGPDSKIGFALALFVGLIAHGILSESLVRSPGLILSNVNFVKKVVFPLEILPWVVMGSTLFHAFVSLAVWSVFFVGVFHAFHITAIFVPLILFPLIFFSMGVSWFLSAVGVFLRDVAQIVNMLSTVLLFMAPILYPMSAMPEIYRPFLYLNPLTFVIEQIRAVLMSGQLPNWTGLIIAYIISLVVAWTGYAWFQKTRKGFADVL